MPDFLSQPLAAEIGGQSLDRGQTPVFARDIGSLAATGAAIVGEPAARFYDKLLFASSAAQGLRALLQAARGLS
jgi:hypothetical protein